MSRPLTAIVLVLCSLFSFAQKKSAYNPEKITEAHLQQKIYSIDSSADAVVLTDVGQSSFSGNNAGWFSLEYTRLKRIHILKKSAYKMADFEIELYKDGDREEKVNSIKAITYNLEGGKVVETPMEKSAIFTNKIDKNHFQKKFTLPNVKEGSIIEVEYKVTSDFLFNLQAWQFQDKIPTLWSEYRLSLPEFFGYVFITRGLIPFEVNERKTRQERFSVIDGEVAYNSKTYNIDGVVDDYRWAMKNVPSLKEESFTSTLRNHLSKIEFQLSEYRKPLTPRKILATWPQAIREMMERPDFGGTLSTYNNFLSDAVAEAVIGATTLEAKIEGIYNYVRDHISCTSYNALYMQQTLKEVLKTKKGTVAEVNLLLVAMLKFAGFTADPVILSTRWHGVTFPMYPILSEYNYVVCQAEANGKAYLLDASHPRLGFTQLPASCYNGAARVMNERATVLELQPDILNEFKQSFSLITNKADGSMNVQFKKVMGADESYQMREALVTKGKEPFIKDIKKGFTFDVDVKQARFDSVEKFEQPIAFHMELEAKPANEDILYINPMFGEGEAENPFKATDRLYPVEMPYLTTKIYTFSMEVPKGYVVDELPKSLRVKLNEQGEGNFEYQIESVGNQIRLRSFLSFKRATYMPEEYEQLREFYNLVVNKHNEQIVLKKKS